MDRDHSRFIIILLGGILVALAGILFVLLVGREEAISAIGGASGAGAFAVALVVGTLGLLFIGYVLRKRRQGHTRGYSTSFYGPPTLEFLWFLALLPSMLSTRPVAGLKSALSKFRFIGSRSRSCSWARCCVGSRIS
jgi:hypothetical protein